jgi:CBS domain-containing protein
VVLIFNVQNELVGMVRRRDIMRGLEPDFLVSKPLPHRKAMFEVETDDNLTEMFFDKFTEGVRKRSDRLVSAVMMPVKFTIKHNDHVLKAVYEMVDHNLALLPVMKGEKVIGILRSVDVFRELTRLALDPNDMEKPCCCVTEPK